jgi:SDR family mycofactocin-dependent oxidoreductase
VARRLEGKVAFISGAARGQGRSHAVRFAEEGADIVAWDICSQIASVGYPMSTPEDLRETARLVNDLDRRIVTVQADARDPQEVQAVFDEGWAEFGRCDSVLINHGIMPFVGDTGDDREAWLDCIDVMLTGVYNTLRAAVPPMIDAGQGGSIVITSSMAGVRPIGEWEAGSLGYVAAKTGVIGLMRLTARQLGKYSIRCNTVHPTGVRTPMVENAAFELYVATHHESFGQIKRALPISALDPVDISNMMVYLCSDEARYVTGDTILLDAGTSVS